MKKVQTAMYEYFMQKGFLRGCVNVNFVLYGVGLLLLALGVILRVAVLNGIGIVLNDFLYAAGLIFFWAGIVFTVAKGDNTGLIIAFCGYILIFFAAFIISFVDVFRAAVLLIDVFAAMLQLTVAIILLMCTIHGMPKYIVYKERKRAEAAAYAAAAAQAAYNAAQQAPYAPPAAPYAPAGQACFSCGFPIASGAVFCPKCGAKQEKPQASVGKKCPTCGMDLAPEAAFCVKCGTKVS